MPSVSKRIKINIENKYFWAIFIVYVNDLISFSGTMHKRGCSIDCKTLKKSKRTEFVELQKSQIDLPGFNCFQRWVSIFYVARPQIIEFENIIYKNINFLSHNINCLKHRLSLTSSMKTSTFGLENKINRLFVRVGPFLRER